MVSIAVKHPAEATISPIAVNDKWVGGRLIRAPASQRRLFTRTFSPCLALPTGAPNNLIIVWV